MRVTRTRKCRWSHRCGLCGGYVTTGMAEALVTGKGWCHLDCVVAGQRGTAA
jgi:hypothetical protein